SGSENVQALRKSYLQFFKLLIDVNPNSLESARRRILAWLARGNGFCHDLGKLPCAVDRLARSSRNNRSCNLFSKPFFAIALDDLPNFSLGSLCKPLARRYSAIRIHSHVEWSIFAEAKTPLSRIELGRRHAQVEQHPVNFRNVRPCQRFTDPAEVHVKCNQPGIGCADG